MKTLSKLMQALAAVLSGFAATPVQADSVSYTASFDISLLDTAVQTAGGASYIRLEYPGLHAGGAVGAPELPVCLLRFSVPYNASDFIVTATPTGTASRAFTAPVYPVQPEVTCNESPAGFVAPDSANYNSSRSYPATLAEVVERGFMGGDNQIVTVALNPVSYAPLTGKVTLYTSIAVTLSYTAGSGGLTKSAGSSAGMQALAVQKTEQNRQADIAHVEQTVVNPSQVAGFAPVPGPSSRGLAIPFPNLPTISRIPGYQYCVVTSRELAPAFDRLIAWKRQKGYTAGVVCIEDILTYISYSMGDLVSNINDDAGRLRAYLRDVYERDSTRYVLLAGDYSVVPIRYATGIMNGAYPIPSDLYFSDLNGCWNVDGDSFYGEFYDGEAECNSIDYNPEIYVGRLLCTNAQDIANYTEKLFRYEQNPGKGDYSYLKKAFYCQSDQMQYKNEADSIISAWGTVFTQDTVLQEIPGANVAPIEGPTGTEAIQEMNKRYGFFSWHGHGAPTSIAISSTGIGASPLYAIVPFNGVLAGHEQHYWVELEEGHGLDSLTNQDYPAIAYSISCNVTPFDIFDIYDVSYNIGSSYTVRGLYGGPAFLGNTRYGWTNKSAKLEDYFVEHIKGGFYQIGVAEALSKTCSKSDSLDKWCRMTHNLIGCPEFEMWTDIPVHYNSVSIQRSDNGITLSGSELPGSKIGIYSGADQPPVFIEATETAYSLNDVSPNSVVTVYRHNAIPYIAPLRWQNDTIAGTRYFVVHDVTMGEAADPGRSAGELVISGGTVTLESYGDVCICEGTVVEEGAHLVVKNNGSVTIDGLVVRNGGQLTIEGKGTVTVMRGQAETGCTFEVTATDEFENRN